MNNDQQVPHFQMISVLATIATVTMIATIIYAISYQSQKPSDLLDNPKMDTTLTAPAISSTPDLETAEATLDNANLESTDELDRLESEANAF